MSRRSGPGGRRKLAFATIAVVGSLVGIELTARLGLELLPASAPAGDYDADDGWLERLRRDLSAAPASPSLYIPDKQLLWRLRPGQSLALPTGVYETRSTPPTWHLTTNADGHRGPRYPRTGAGPVVVTIGDSCTFGFRVDDDETYPRQLETWLRAHGLPTATVVNLGVPGYSSFQGRRVLTSLLARHAPEAVVIAFGANDLEADRLTDVAKQARLGSSSLRFLYLAERLATVRLARHLAGQAARTDPAAATGARTRRVPTPELSSNLRAMIADAHAALAQVVVADQVFVSAELRYTIEGAATAAGAPFVDGRQVLAAGLERLRTDPELAAEARRIDQFWDDQVVSYRHAYYGEPFYAELFADPARRALLRYFMIEPVHPNALGNRLIAEAIGAALLQAGLSPER